MQTLQLLDPYIGRFFSEKWVKTNVLRFNDDEIETMQEEMDEEAEEMQQRQQEQMAAQQGDGQDDGSGDAQQQQQQGNGGSSQKKIADINNQVKQLASGDQ
jgi:RNA polymerase-binding transcription factor DksA